MMQVYLKIGNETIEGVVDGCSVQSRRDMFCEPIISEPTRYYATINFGLEGNVEVSISKETYKTIMKEQFSGA